MIEELTVEAREKLKREQAHRFPELFHFPKPGPDGKPIKLPVVLGIPSGAARLPEGERASKAWGQKVAQTFGAIKDGDYLLSLIPDCVLWPSQAVWATWMERWPALPESVRPALVRKYGGAADQVTEPDSSETVASEIAAARESAPGSSWIRFTAKDAHVDIAVRAPSSMQWAAFSEAMKRPGAEHWTLALDLATACTVAATKPVAEVFARWPGLALQVDREASYLAGLATEYEEGEL